MNLILITTTFPYGTKESFLESELIHAEGRFDRIDVFALFPEDHAIRKYNAPSNIFYHQVHLGAAAKLEALLKIPFKKFFWEELVDTKRRGLLTVRSLRHLVYTTMMAMGAADQIVSEYNHFVISLDEIVIYSYWLSIHAVVNCLLKRIWNEVKGVSRAHGYDLYENRNDMNYIPYRRFLLKNLDKVFPISNNGRKYLEKYNITSCISVRRLGTLDHGIEACFSRNENIIRIVSCSWCVPVKRIDLIIKALAQIKVNRVEWTHFGDGVLLEPIKTLAHKNLSSNIVCHFPGACSNLTINQYYKTHSVDAFVNVSSSEGIPVSIMEAMSYGIPAIATDVGATSELVNNDNGILLDSSFAPVQLANAIINLHTMPNAEYMKIRQNAREYWCKHYNARANYDDYYNELSNLFNTFAK